MITAETSIDELTQDAGLTEDEFCQKHPHSYLMLFKAPVKVTSGSSKFRTTGILNISEVCKTSKFYELALTGFQSSVIGRGTGNDISLDHSEVSRMHAMIFLGGRENYCIKDMNSENGTFLDDKKLKPHDPNIIKDGQVIRFSESVATMLLSPQSVYGLLQDYQNQRA